MGHKAGDNAQLQALADALGWDYHVKRFVYRKTELITNRLVGVTLAGIYQRKSSRLEPPWPDLVISAGRRNEPVARWIRRHADRHVHLVHLGRPWAPLDRFDLLITTPQYQLPQRPNILHNLAPLHRVTDSRLMAAAAEWSPRLARLPRPYIAVLVGGHSGSFVFDAQAAAQLGAVANTMAAAVGGTLLLTTSVRTPRASVATLETAISAPRHIFRWRANAADNPYYGYLALADAFIVTADSMSMLTEACGTRKPVYIFDPNKGRQAKLFSGFRGYPVGRFRFQSLVQWLSLRIGPKRMRRDVSALHRRLIADKRAVWLGEDFPRGQQPPPLNDIERAVDRVRTLFQADAS